MRQTCISQLFALAFLGPLLALASPTSSPDVEPATAESPAGSSALQTPYKTEQEWIVSSICRNAFELLAYAKDKKGETVNPGNVLLTLIPGSTLEYDVTVKGASTTVEAKLQWPGSLWDPSAYVPFCQAAAKALALPPAPEPKAQGNPLHDLLDFSEEAIEKENRRVSQWLATEPGNASAQEQAALILGTLAMKENSGYFWDPRDECNHVAAHLAVAQFLRNGSPTSIEGRLANILVGLIVDTKTQTGSDLDQLASEKSPPADLAAWLNACRMRNTRDWRKADHPETASPLEQVEYFRAYSEAVDTDLAIAWLQKYNVEKRIDWQRIVIEMEYSADAGHAYAEGSIAQEIHLMQTTFPGSFGGMGLTADLNEPSGDAVNFNGATGTPLVINRGMWAQFFQRHLCEAIIETGDFFANKWGVPENARALDQTVEKTFRDLALYPYMQLIQRHKRHVSASAADGLNAFVVHPEWAPDCLYWLKMPNDPNALQLTAAAKAWFGWPAVHGTAYGAMSRMIDLANSGAQIDQLYAIAPLQIRIAQWKVQRLYGKNFTFDQFQKVMGPLPDYYVELITQAQDAIDLTFDHKVQLAQKAADIDPGNYFVLARIYQENHQDDKAAEAYQNWFDKAPDRTAVSDNVDWLVNYYFDHGKTDQALVIANDAAQVYSSAGLETMMHLQEKMGHLDEAESWGQKIQERYNELGPLASFYQRRADKGDAAYKAKFDELAGKAFPNGIKKITVTALSGAPTAGMQFLQTNDALQAVGLSSDMVIVGIDGYEVDTEAQYTFARDLSDSPDMHFIVWDGKSYREIVAHRPGRHFGVDMRDYHP